MSKPIGHESMCGDTFLGRAVENFRAQGTVRGLWRLDREPVSLGGLLLLRAELELLAALCGVDQIVQAFVPAASGSEQHTHALTSEALKSARRYSVEFRQLGTAYWPDLREIYAADFSYKHFDRCTRLHNFSGLRPTLAWDAATLHAAAQTRRSFCGRLYTAHLKQVIGAGEEQSNANLKDWYAFLRGAAKSGKEEFLLLGGDLLPSEFRDIPGVHSAHDRGITLSAQLALVQLSDGFLGMASGVCAAAILSAVPYTVFKHPHHHIAEMNRQIGLGESFSFAIAGQQMRRARATAEELSRAFDLLRRSAS